jgi:predicted GNAT family acetyltransferase
MAEKANVDADDDIDVRDHPQLQRFEVWVGGERAGFTRYEPRGGDLHAFTHTEIDEPFEHRGLAARLVSEALATARERGWTVLPECPYVRKYVDDNRELLDLVPVSERHRFRLD